MPVELKIYGEHATDLIAELQNIATAFGVGTTPAKNAVGAPSKSSESTTSAPSQPATSTVAPQAGGKTDAKKTLNRKEQDDATAEMVKAGAKDDRFELLTKGRQNEVEAALAKAAAPAGKSADADLDDMFGDDTAPAAVTREQVSELMGKIGKDEKGNPIQPRLLKIRAILVDLIPEGEEVKVKNLPDDKLAEAFEKIGKVTD